SGAILNLYLFYLVSVSKSTSDRVYKIEITVFSLHGFFLCVFIAIMNYAHVFREGTFITAVLGPLATFLPIKLSMLIIRITMVLVTMMWTLIPATSALQLMTLSRKLHWSVTKRLILSFLFPCLCIAIVATTVEELIPSASFEKIMIRITREVYEMNENMITFGSTMRYPERNYNRSLIYFALFYAIVPYSLTYAVFGALIYQIQKRLRVRGMAVSQRTAKMQRAFFVMQLLQSVLPLVILSSPFTVFLYGVFTQTDLVLSALWFTSFLWICPSVQAIVQLRYIRQAAKARALEPTKI
ncbi:hypothetical protein PENTCL1PPCAC_15458, partial [Pristionchus entomophagus]